MVAVNNIAFRIDLLCVAGAIVIASAAVLVHSLVDFPLRTAAISACFAMCLALLTGCRLPVRQDKSDLRPTRHVIIG